MNAYEKGFMDTCNVYGIDPIILHKEASPLKQMLHHIANQIKGIGAGGSDIVKQPGIKNYMHGNTYKKLEEPFVSSMPGRGPSVPGFQDYN